MRRFNNKLYGWIRRKYIIEIKKTHEKMSIDRKGEGNPYAKAVIVDGVEYESVENASKKLNIPLRSINNRILNPEYVNYNYKGIPYKMTCIYCGELVKTSYLYKKYHGENCKNKEYKK